MLVVVDPAHGDDFLVEVYFYAKFSEIIVMCFNFLVLIYGYFCMQINEH